MKRYVPVLLLALAFAASVALAQPSALPDDPRFDEPVALSTGADGEELAAMVDALARSVGLTPVLDGVPTVTVRYEIAEAKPFRQVWDLVLSLNDLDFVLQPNDVVVVGPEAQLATLRQRGEDEPATTADPASDSPIVQRFYRINGDTDQIAVILRRAIEGSPQIDTLPGVSSIVVIGDEDQQAQVVELLNEFDVAPERVELEQRVYALSNATAVDLADVLQSTEIVVGGQAAGAGGENGGAPTFSVVADERTNSIIVTATRALQEGIAELIPDLDVPQQQVSVQVRIQEVNRRTVESFGIDLDASFGNLAANILGAGLQFVFDAQTVVTELNLSAVLDALESQGLSTRVDDSTITVLNNETGRLQSGGRIEITFPSADGEIATRTIEFGVIIEVTPRIASDGSVILDVTAEVSDVLVPLAEGGIPERIDFSTRELSSTVSMRPGQTVLLGGLLQNSFTQTQRRVPILGEIPVLGALFGSTEVEDDNTELLLVVNADVID